MSRSLKTGPDRSETDNPGSEKSGSRGRPALRPRSDRQNWLLSDRRSYGSTEKILRRNRKLWTRMFSKEGRKLDRQVIADQVSDG
jgi:hypothetical protein